MFLHRTIEQCQMRAFAEIAELLVVYCVWQKETKMFFCNILYKTLAILMKSDS